ncbi:transglutaminase domain-containing protein [Candidatus Woesearchaeota archaeon]|nr:transglutaminase domain-containing protein [Candidatus Woesearchaeota archaeon]
MNKKIGVVIVLVVIVMFLVGCQKELETVEIINEEGNIVGEAFRFSERVYQLRTVTPMNIEETYVELFDLQTLPAISELTPYYGGELNYLGNLAPFPTKSLQSHNELKSWGIVDSKQANLKLFYLQEGPLTEITNIVQANADLIEDGETTEDTVRNIMEWLHQTSSGNCNNHRNAVSADEIISRKCLSGCTDYTIVFAALARAKGIAATVTETVREQWIAEMVWNNQWNGNKEGHFFSEVYMPENDAWVVIDPTANKLTGRDSDGYYPSGPEGNKRFMLFERGLDPADYGLTTDAQFANSVKNRYYVEQGDQP